MSKAETANCIVRQVNILAKDHIILLGELPILGISSLKDKIIIEIKTK